MKILSVTCAEIEQLLDDLYEDEEMHELEEFKIQPEGVDKDCIITDGPAVRVTDLGLIFVEGTYCNYNEETDELEADWSLTLLYDDVPDEEFDVEKYLYFEQDSPMITIHNFLNIRK